MASSANDDGDLSKHLVISKSITIDFKKVPKTSRNLGLYFNNVPVSLSNAETTDKKTRRWTLNSEIRVFPHFDDTVTLRVAYGKMKLFEAPEEFRVTYKDFADKFNEQGQGAIPFTFGTKKWTVTLEVAIGDIEDIVPTESMKDLDPLLPKRVQDAIDSGDSFLKNTQKLKSILEIIPIPENALKVLEGIGETAKDLHPLARAVMTALSIPYKLLKNERNFKDGVKALAEAMRSMSKCLIDVEDHTKISSAKELFVYITRILRDAALFIEIYQMKSGLGQFIGAQFPKKLGNYAEDLKTKRDEFARAMTVQIAVHVDEMKPVLEGVADDVRELASKTSEADLEKRLCPVKQQPFGGGCLKGTRVKILDEARGWLKNNDSQKNILWIVGAPGAGKSTIATTLATTLGSPCAKFFCKRDVSDLRNPRNIWRTLAYDIAVKHKGLKDAHTLALSENLKKCEPQDDLAVDQFLKLIKGPLETVPVTTYPVIIVDAIDECYSPEDDSWQSLLESLTRWSELAGVFELKLIVTSRDIGDIRATLGEVSHQINLTTGDNASEDSKSDIGVFFTEKFAEIRRRFSLSLSDWPKMEVIKELIEYAAGLFIWADMVIKYVGHRAVGRIPANRLQDVLSDIKSQFGSQRSKTEGLDGRDRVDRLYARIVFEAFRHSTANEREAARIILAAVVLAKEPLRTCDLVDLLSTDTSDSSDVLASIESTLWELSPVIPVTDGANGKLRVFHKTVSDFLLSHDRSLVAFNSVVKTWTPPTPDASVPDPHSFILDLEKDNRNLALACVHLARRNFSLEIQSIAELLKQSNGLKYAHRHWYEHLEHSGGSRVPNLKCLADAMELAYGCLQKYVPQMMFAKGKTITLTEELRDAADFASQCINEVSDERPQLELELKTCAKNLDIARGNFQIAMIVNLASDIDESSPDAPDTFLRKRLEPSIQSLLDDECLKGTRVGVLQQAKDWLEDTKKPNILWIYGAPGAGKSAIATTLAKQFSGERLCVKVVAKRDFADRRDPRRVWQTLVYNLAGLHAGLKGSIMEALFEKSDYSPDEFRDLIVKVMRDQQFLSLVVVLDALDELFTEDNNDWRALLHTVAGCAHLPPQSFRLVVTSRDIPDIRSALAEVSHSIGVTTGKEASTDAKSDTQVFFRTKFEEMRKGFEGVPLDWPGEDVIQKLTEHAAGSFIWAKMIVELVKLGPHVVDHLEDMLSGVELESVDSIYKLYAKILFDFFAQLDGKERKVSRLILAAIVLAKDPLRKRDLIELLSSSDAPADKTRQLVENAFDQLSCVISVDDSQLVRIPHKSFADFLLEHDRSLVAMRHVMPSAGDRELRLYLIDWEEDSATMAIACLRLMNGSLTFNPCGINTSHLLNDEIPELDALISKNVSTTLIYACRFWDIHLDDGPRDEWYLRAVQPLLQILLHEKVLFWLEILSLVNATPIAEESLLAAAAFLKGHNNSLADAAKDVSQFARTFQEAIAIAAPHIYISALPFCPTESWMACIYGPQYPNCLTVESGRRLNWDEAVMSDGHDGEVNSVAFFPDGKKLASGSMDKTVRVWDSETGKAISAPFTGHSDPVQSVAVSPDGTCIASVSRDGTLRIHDSHTGACPLGPIAAHSDVIFSVAFSSDGSRIVTGSMDNTLKVWNVATGDLCLGPLRGHTNWVISVAFSPDSTRIASGSVGETIRIWDASTGESCREPLIGHTETVTCVAFSADGHHLASGSYDDTLRLWDVTQGFAEVASVTIEGIVSSVSFSPDSNILVSGSKDGALRFWNIRSGKFEQSGKAIFGHRVHVRSVAFSCDGLSVASGSDDSSVKIWTVPTTCTQPLAADHRITENTPISLDQPRCPVLSDGSYIDRDGWMHDSRGEDSRRLFWVPEENRAGFWWPRNTAVMARIVTKIDFARFVHGNNWSECYLEVV